MLRACETGAGMNILFTASTLPRFENDMQPPFVLHQAQAWKHKRPGDDVIILAPDDVSAAPQEMVGDIEVRRYRYAFRRKAQTLAYPAILPNIRRHPHRLLQLPGFLIGQYLSARRLVRRRKIDLVYAHWVAPQGVVAWLLHKTHRVPFMLQTHSSDLSVLTRLGAPGRMFARMLIRDARRYFCVNRDQADAALALFSAEERAGIEAKLTVLPMGVGDEVCDQPAPSRPRFDFCFLGRLTAKKGVNAFLAAAQSLATKRPDLSIGMAGDGELRDEILSTGFVGHLHYAGFISGRQKIEFLNNSRFAVFPSISTNGDVEGLPVALLEALCMGKIVAASRDTNIELLPEWPRLRELVYLIDDPTDTEAFAALLDEMYGLPADVLDTRASRIRLLAEHYRWDRLIDDYLAAVA